MAGTHVISLRDLPKALARDMKNVTKATKRALVKASKSGRGTVKRNVPVAFGELRESVHSTPTEEGARIIADAPHAAAVENGSRPHWVPLDALVKWVKLRGAQFASTTARQRTRLAGNTSAFHANFVGLQLQAMARRGEKYTGVSVKMSNGVALARAYTRSAKLGSIDIDAPKEIAKAIQLAIAAHGTKPHHYMLGSLPAIEADVDRFVAEEVSKA